MGNPQLRFFLHPFILLVGVCACSLGGPLREDAKATSYRIGSLPARWEKQNLGSGADSAFINHASGAVMAVYSVCQRYEEVPLDSLKKDLENPIDSREVLLDVEHPLDGRSAAFTKIKGKTDGVPVESYLVTVRKDDCIFDFSLFARDQIGPQDEKDFLQMVDGFHYAGGSHP